MIYLFRVKIMLCYFLYPQIKVFNSIIMELINKNSLRAVHKTGEMMEVRWGGLESSYSRGTENHTTLPLVLLEKLQ